MTLRRPRRAPRRLPLWAWELNHWLDTGRKGPRPTSAPAKSPLWFHLWRHWHKKRHTRKAVRHHRKHVKRAPADVIAQHRARIVHHARYTASPAISPQVHYTQDARRDDWLVNDTPNEFPQWTDCSGHGTQCNYVAKTIDPNGLGYKWLGWTGTLLTFAAKVGRVTTDLSKGLPGDHIVVGEGAGVHETTIIEAGRDPLVASHGHEGVQIYRASADPRQPKRVCQVLPA